MRTLLGSRVAALLGPLALLAASLSACGSGEVTVTGRLKTTEVFTDAVYESMGIPVPKCGGWRKVQVEDGAGKILRVEKTSPSTGKADKPEADVHTLTCEFRYEVKVPEADVYTVGFPKLTDYATGSAVEQTLNRSGDRLKVPTMEAMLKALGI
jgi:hypothetical protein